MLEGAVPNTRGQMIRYLFLKKHLDLEYMRRHCTSFLIRFGFHFYNVLQVCFWGWSFATSNSQSLSK